MQPYQHSKHTDTRKHTHSLCFSVLNIFAFLYFFYLRGWLFSIWSDHNKMKKNIFSKRFVESPNSRRFREASLSLKRRRRRRHCRTNVAQDVKNSTIFDAEVERYVSTHFQNQVLNKTRVLKDSFPVVIAMTTIISIAQICGSSA